MRKIKYPLIVSDFDGTLVREDGTVSQTDANAINAYIAAGGVFAISTGRLPAAILPRARELGLKGLLCCCQGAIILDIESGKVIFDGKLSLRDTLTACKKMEEMGLHIQLFDLWTYYSNMDDDLLKMYERVAGTKAKLCVDKKLSELVAERELAAYKLLAMVQPQDNARVLRALTEAKLPGCSVTTSMAWLVEVINAEYSKGSAVAYLSNRYGVPIEKTVAVGDQCNDIPMIERAGIGIAVQNADARLKEQADYVLERTNEENAIAEMIEKFGFEEEIF